MARMLAVVLALTAFLPQAAALGLERPKGARRRAMERAAARRLAGGDEVTTPKPPEVFCPEKDVVLEGSAEAGTYMTISSWRGGSLLGNWLAHTRLLSEDDPKLKLKVVNVALDKGAMNGCENFRNSLPAEGGLALTCVSLAGWLPESMFNAETATVGRANHCENSLALWARPIILLEAVRASDHPIMLVNTDVIMHKDILGLGAELLESGKRTMAAMEEGNGKLNTDTVFASKASLPFLEAWAGQGKKCMNAPEPDKGALQHVMHYGDGDLGPKLATFYTSEIGQCMRRGEYATHFNCAGKHATSVMKSMHNWADGIAPEPEKVVKPGQLFTMTAKKNPTKKAAA